MFLILACTAPTHITPEDSPPDSEPAPESAPPDSQDTGPAPCTEEVDWADPLVPGVTLPISSHSPHLTDGVMAGDHLVLVGQDVYGGGTIWSWDLSDPDDPQLQGSAGQKQLMAVCWGGERGYAFQLEGALQRFSVGDDGPTFDDFVASSGDPGTRLDCDGTWLAWGRASDGGALAPFDAPASPVHFGDDVRDVELEGDRMWSVGYDGLASWDLSTGEPVAEGSLELPGRCTDLAAGDDWLVAGCGHGGVHLIDRNDGQPELLSTWSDWTSSRTVAVSGDRVVISGWSDWVVLDASDPTTPTFLTSEPAVTAASAAVAHEDGRLYLVDWKDPLVATVEGTPGPEIRLDRAFVRPGDVVRVENVGTEPLCLQAPNTGTLDATAVLPDEATLWRLGEDITEGSQLMLRSDDPDESELLVEVGGLDGLVVGDEAPPFLETDLDGVTWSSEELVGQVIFLGLLDAW